MQWMSVFDAVFFVTIGTLLTGFFGLVIKYCLKSKCEHISFCWGCFSINRRVDLEVQEEIKELELASKKVSGNNDSIEDIKNEV